MPGAYNPFKGAELLRGTAEAFRFESEPDRMVDIMDDLLSGVSGVLGEHAVHTPLPLRDSFESIRGKLADDVLIVGVNYGCLSLQGLIAIRLALEPREKSQTLDAPEVHTLREVYGLGDIKSPRQEEIKSAKGMKPAVEQAMKHGAQSLVDDGYAGRGGSFHRRMVEAGVLRRPLFGFRGQSQ